MDIELIASGRGDTLFCEEKSMDIGDVFFDDDVSSYSIFIRESDDSARCISCCYITCDDDISADHDDTSLIC